MVRHASLLVLLTGSALAAFPAFGQISHSTWGQGGIRIGDSTTTCDSGAEGSLRYNDTTNVHQFCDGTAWANIGGSVGPDSLDFTEFLDAMNLDASTSITADGTEVFSIINTGTGNSFLVGDQASDPSPFVIDESGNVSAGGQIFAGSHITLANTFASFRLRGGTTLLNSPAAAHLQLGGGDVASPIAQTLGVQNVVAGTTNTAGVDFTIQGSIGTGTGQGGSILFRTAPAGSSGSTQNALATAMTITNAGNIGIGTTGPQSKLHVEGEVKIGNSGLACSSSTAGALRYNSTANNYEFCDSTTWRTLGGNPSFEFSDISGAPTGTLVYSNTIIVSGFVGSRTVTITGNGSPEFSINGAAFTSASTSINSGQTLQLRLTSAVNGNTVYSATVNVGPSTDTWTVTTASRIIIYHNNSQVAGNFGSSYGGGRAGVDAFCTAAKPAALNCNAPIRAFVSLSASDSINSFPTNYSIPTGVPLYWYNRTLNTANVQIGTNWADILDTSIINSAQTGGINTGASVWTGSNNSGANSGSNCSAWTSNSSAISGTYGQLSSTASTWLNATQASCNQLYTVFCLCVQN